MLVSSNVTFTVVADGTSPLRYQWQFNGNNLTGATNTGFAGVYNYRPASKSFRIFALFLESLPGPNDMLVVHPGLEERWRRREYEALRKWNAPSGIVNRFLWDKL